jgi:outer membrane lipoprotein-sorting protein
MRLLVSFVLVFSTIGVAVARDMPNLEETVQKVQEVYSRQCCFRAFFDQLMVNVSMDLKDKFEGTLYVRTPGLIALDVKAPERQKVVIQGRSYTVYFPEEGNATQGEVPPEMNVEHFFGFFARIGEMERNFAIRFAARPTDEAENLIFLELADKKNPHNTYQIMLGIDYDTYTIRRAIIYDALGNYNRFDLHDIVFLKTLPREVFEIRPNRMQEMNAPRKSLQEEIGQR